MISYKWITSCSQTGLCTMTTKDSMVFNGKWYFKLARTPNMAFHILKAQFIQIIIHKI